ncbi:hypothetical protein FFWV33_06790 [Flavobacterium faecale]|uniref:Lipoprotein n=1 Tax=Flavobacterium faecale TaxID=1355330 RepID=A0A2S1LBX6_9FLAO|nr:hypothetical protein [Flavobacterium faecale]AWG21260.1 hypothetical protein FFWV33_06790 [Flavobacterium faecale]
MKIKNLLVLAVSPLFLSCVMVMNKIEELKPIENYSTENIIIEDKKTMDVEILFINDKSVKTKLKGETNLFDKTLLNETSINKYFAILDNEGKKNYISYELVKNMTFKDLKGNLRTFVNRGNMFKSLQEVIYDGKIKWFIEYYPQAYDQSVQVNNHFVNENNQTVVVGTFNNMKNKLKEITSSKPELINMIDETEKFSTEAVIEILKKYEE